MNNAGHAEYWIRMWIDQSTSQTFVFADQDTLGKCLYTLTIMFPEYGFSFSQNR